MKKGYQPTLKCNGTVMDKFKSVTYNGSEIIKETPMYVGTLTADEMVYAGGKYFNSENMPYYGNYTYLYPENHENLASPASFSLSLAKNTNYQEFNVVWFNVHGYIISADPEEYFPEIRPAIILEKNSPIIKGDGTQMNPYVVN